MKIEEIRTNTEGASAALRNRSADLALTLEPISDNGIESILLLEEPMYALLGKDSPLSRRASISMEDLAGLPVITQPEGYGTNRMAKVFFRNAGLDPKMFVHVMDPESIVIQVPHRKGAGFIPESTYRFNIRNSNVIMGMTAAVPLREEYCRRRVYLSCRKDAPLGIAADSFHEFLRMYGSVIREKRCLPDEDDFRVAGAFQMRPVPSYEVLKD